MHHGLCRMSFRTEYQLRYGRNKEGLLLSLSKWRAPRCLMNALPVGYGFGGRIRSGFVVSRDRSLQAENLVLLDRFYWAELRSGFHVRNLMQALVDRSDHNFLIWLFNRPNLRTR